VRHEVASLREAGPTAFEVLSAVKTTRTSREEEQRTNKYWLGAIASAYNAPRYSGDASATLREKEDLWQELAAALEAEANKAKVDAKADAKAGSSEEKADGEAPQVEPRVILLRAAFAKLLPADAPCAVVSIQPASSTFGGPPSVKAAALVALGAAGVAAAAWLLVKARRSWR